MRPAGQLPMVKKYGRNGTTSETLVSSFCRERLTRLAGGNGISKIVRRYAILSSSELRPAILARRMLQRFRPVSPRTMMAALSAAMGS